MMGGIEVKYKVGDKVRVRKDLEVHKCYGMAPFSDLMVGYLGKTVEISCVHSRHYNIKGDRFLCWTDEMFDVLAKEESKVKYKTWEVVKMLTENHELVFVRPSDGVRTMLGDKIHAGEIIGKYLKQTNGEGIRLSDEWELVPQPITFTEAVKAAIEGKKPNIVLNDIKCELIAEECISNEMGYSLRAVSKSGTKFHISTGMIDGMWTVE
jgi:hypothetical protein